MLNGSTLNGATLNGAPPGSVLPEPITIEPVAAMVWAPRVLVNGQDLSHLVTGQVKFSRAEGGRAVADVLFLVDPGTLDPASWDGKAVEIFYRDLVAGVWRETLRYRGWIEGPELSQQTRILRCQCSDRLQEDIEALPIEQIDALTAGIWSEDVFEPVAGRSRWDYAQERLSTRAASLQRSIEGAWQVTDWAVTPPAYIIPAGTVMFESLEWLPAAAADRTNVVVVEADYRFIRLRERHQAFSWRHPDIVGDSIDNGFCVWRHDDTDLPDLEMIADASKGAGYGAILKDPFWLILPPNGVYCDPPAGWTNKFNDQVLRASWTSARRWSQRVTEQYTLRIEAPASVAAIGEVIARDRVTLETEADREEEFLQAEFDSPDADAVQDALGDYVVDLREQARADVAVVCMLKRGEVQILGEHRQNRLTFDLPSSDALPFRLEHTLDLRDVILGSPVRCVGKVFSLSEVWDLDSGTAITTVELAVSQGGGLDADVLTPPPKPPSTPPGSPPLEIVLPTQLGGRNSSPIYDDELDGFAGNYTQNDLDINPALELFEYRFQVTAPEIPAEHQDEYLVPAEQTYRVRIPHDLLEL
ncbi:hypothetical protein ABS648_03440 [Pseudomonas solani]|uniref:Tip attachment protein J domain-containing protein n=1 Tax=Pseudomonas solani TaxID=2731552 RepID=A0AAU7Y722_9PSED